MTDLWPSLEPVLLEVERPVRYIDREWGAPHKPDAAYRAVLMYPDTYEIGQANQAVALLGAILNSVDDVACERAFVPWKDLSAIMRERDIPLFSLESCAPVKEFDLVGITLPHELACTNIIEALDLSGIPIRAVDRIDGDPLVIGGGPCAYNPEPFAPFFDAILVGEGEEAIIEIVSSHRAAAAAGSTRREIVESLAAIPGVYVPSLYEPRYDRDGVLVATEPVREGVPPIVVKRVVRDFESAAVPECPIVPYMDVVHDRISVEVLRGCTRGCRFCQAGMIYRPVRERTADTVVGAVMRGLACTGYDEVSLTSLSTTDHSQLEEILRRLSRRLEGTGVGISLPSQRVDAFGIEMARLISGNKKSGLTFAPEAGTQRMRDVINKGVTEEDLLVAVSKAFEAGWRRVKLYFMIGLPGEADEDIRGIGDLVHKVFRTAREATPPSQRGGLKVSVSVSTFIPKSNTPFQWDAQIPFEEIDRRHKVLRDSVPYKGVDLHWHDSEVSFLEGVVAMGDRRVADLIETSWRAGSLFDAWTEGFSLARWREAAAATGIDLESIANRERDEDEVLPWSHISSGVSTKYLLRERRRSREGITTPDCSFGGCTGCDVCGDLDVDIALGGVSR